MKMYRIFFVIVTFFLLTACMNGTETNGGQEGEDTGSEPVAEEPSKAETEEADEVAEKEETEKEKAKKPDSPTEVAEEIVSAMEQKDMETLASYVHRSKGVRFTPYAYVDVEQDKVFTAQEVEGLMADETIYTWGVFDGKGNPIEMTFADYFDRFVYDQDYVNAEEKAVDERLGQGNTLDNSADVYPEGTVVEYHFSGIDPQYEGMDWRSLRLVLEKEDGEWYLVGVIHDEWTI
jgi:hypothetical protein